VEAYVSSSAVLMRAKRSFIETISVREFRWHAEMTEDRSNERISWRTVPGSDVENAGFVEFRADPQGRGTFVTAHVQYDIPGGLVATGLTAAFGKHPEFMLVETGETPTTAGSP
jgi:uncharacterized membrane protein